MVIVAGFGNPLLDITIKTNGNNILKKYNLKDDDQVEFDEIRMRSLMNDIKDFAREYSPGGCAQNTLRIFQWLYQEKGHTYMIGGIGNDDNGITLKLLVENAGVHTLYITNNGISTGMSVAIINQANRSLVASIGAARIIDVESYNKITNKNQLLNHVDIFYMEGFFIPNRETLANYILDFSKSIKKLFAFNISAPYICRENADLVKYFVEYCDILFGNVKEYESLALAMNFKGSILELGIVLSKTNIHTNWKYKKMIVITNGSKNVICIHSEGQICEINVPQIPLDDIKDTTGAGDSFVAGFFFGLSKQCTPEMCLKYGCWTAQHIIKQIGCKVPDYLPQMDKL